MGIEIFNTIISAKSKKENIAGINPESGDKPLDDEAEKVKLLALLPEELRDRSLREEFSLEHVKKIVEFRESKGYKTAIGFHVSPENLPVGQSIFAGKDTNIYFSTSLENLYIGKGSGYIYALECSEKSMKVLDENLNWYTLKGDLKIIDKIKMTPEAIEALGARFAQCEYS
ncbi:MAG: hypothetical protein WCK59_03800 [Candidatus Falkowbacteria bacterium]